MPPKRCCQIPLVIPPAISDPHPTLHHAVSPQRTRSGKSFQAPVQSSTTSRHRRPRHLTPGSPPHSLPRTARKRKSRTVVEDSDSDESTDDETYWPPTTRPRRGNAPNKLTVVGSQPNQQMPGELNECIFTGIEGTRQPP
ncbi:hypothetical protein PtB15_4B205 [Puccinia triticina]|nr:hypothetical protein PtB15_4B205 [Puccinia triticina]